MKKIILSVVIASGLITTGTHSGVAPKIVTPEEPALLKQLRPLLQKLGVNIDLIKRKTARMKLTLKGLGKKQTDNTVALYEGLNRAIKKLQQKTSWAKGQLRDWGWVLLPKLKAKLQDDIRRARELRPELKELLEQLERRHPELSKILWMNLQNSGTP